MHRSISAIARSREVVCNGTRVHVTFETLQGHPVVICAPIEDRYLAHIQPNDRVFFQRDRYGCHHLVRRRLLRFLWPRLRLKQLRDYFTKNNPYSM
jgi:hypothetical protein